MAKKATGKPQGTATKTAPAKKTAPIKKGVDYTFRGQYFSKVGKDVNVKNYEITITFPELLQAPLSVFKNFVSKSGHPVNTIMLKNYPDFSKVRTYSVLKVVSNISTINPKATVETMGLEQLQGYISDNELGIETHIYDDKIEDIRSAIRQAEEDPDAFALTYQKAVEDYKYRKELESLNSGDDQTGDADNSGNEGNGEDDGDLDDLDDLLDDLDGGEGNGEDGNE